MADSSPESHWVISYEVTNISCDSHATPTPQLTININFASSFRYPDDPDRLTPLIGAGDAIGFKASTSVTIDAADDQFNSFEKQIRESIWKVLEPVDVELRDFLQKELGTLSWRTVSRRIGRAPISATTHVVEIGVGVAAEYRRGGGGFGEGSCCICLEEFVSGGGGFLELLPCSHAFHHECIWRWLSRSRDCPICREVVWILQ